MTESTKMSLRVLASGIPLLMGIAVHAQSGQDVSMWGYQFNSSTQSNRLLRLNQSDQRGAVELSCGYYHSIVRRVDGTVASWGGGALVSGADVYHLGQSSVPTNLVSVRQVAAGGWHSLALREDGTVIGWGENYWGAAGGLNGSGSVVGGGTSTGAAPTVFLGVTLQGVQAISAGGQYSAALLADGTIRAWGLNWSGQVLGTDAQGSAITASVPSAGTVQILGTPLTGVARFSAGYHHSAAILGTGSVVCWGAGLQDTGTGESFGQSLVPAGLLDAVEVSAGVFHTAAVRSDGTVVCWGAGRSETGTENYGQSIVPPGLSGVIRVVASNLHTVALKSDGTVVVWGGRGDPVFTPPPGLAGVVTIAAGDKFTAAVKANGEVVVWAKTPTSTSNASADSAYRGVPIPLGAAVEVAAGDSHAMALLADGTVMCWGSNANGRCRGTRADGTPIVDAVDQIPVEIGGEVLRGVTAIAAGSSHSMALRESGLVSAWGSNVSGCCDVPADLGPGVAVAAGRSFSMALLDGGGVRCWGDNSAGQCSVPEGLYAVRRIAAGTSHALALRADGSILCWGSNAAGQCAGTDGRGYTIKSSSGDGRPVRWRGRDLVGATSVAGGGLHSLAALQDGTVVAWGSNMYGTCLGTDAAGKALTSSELGGPVRWNGQVLVGAVEVAAGYQLSAALRSDGSVVAWGAYSTSTGTSLRSASADAPVGRRGFHALAAGYNQIVALQAWDCDANGSYDLADVISGAQADLDGNRVPDACQGVESIDTQVPNLGVPQANTPVTCTFPDLPAAASEVRTQVTARGDFDATNEWLLVRGNEQTLAQRAFELGGVGCAGGENQLDLVTQPAAFNASIAANDRRYEVQLIPSPNVTGSECPEGFMTVRLRYRGMTAAGDCNANAIPDMDEILANPSLDSDGNGVLDSCDVRSNASLDRNGNGIPDSVDIRSNPALDCDSNMRIDSLEIQDSPAIDCDSDGTLDWCQIKAASASDFNRNGRPDGCDIRDDPSQDRDRNGLLDIEDIARNPALDCDSNARIDSFEIADDPARDCDSNGVLDTCTVATGSVAKVIAWGFDAYGQATVPNDALGARTLAGGDWHSLALLPDGTVKAWGQNGSGQCNIPAGLSEVVQVVGGGYHSAALSREGAMTMWGLDSYGQCQAPAGLVPAVRIDAGFYTTAALQVDGRLRIWGWNGVGTCDVPASLGVVSDFACGGYHTLVQHPDGSLTCWGLDSEGQCRPPARLGGVRQPAAGGEFSAALLEGGRVACWGSNAYGQSAPPSGLSGVEKIVAGGQHGLALMQDGSIVGWGAGRTSTPTAPESGQLIIPFGRFLTLGRTLGSHSLAISWPGDVNGNGRPDACDLLSDPSLDRNVNGVIDTLEIQRDPSLDCNANGLLDQPEIRDGLALDCNRNDRIDACDISAGAADEDADGRLDDCELASGDLDMNNEIDYGDLVIILLYFGERDLPFGDLDHNGLIDFGDIAMLMMNFGPTPWP
jgi:alpha-tubulin suppressor-like RCC1 family protein